MTSNEQNSENKKEEIPLINNNQENTSPNKDKKIEQLEKENQYLKAENAYLKKLRALVQERIDRENGKEPPSSMN